MENSNDGNDGGAVVSLCCKPFQCFGSKNNSNGNRHREVITHRRHETAAVLEEDNKKARATTSHMSSLQSSTSLADFYDAEEGTNEQWLNGDNNNNNSNSNYQNRNRGRRRLSHMGGSLHYFDAEDNLPDFNIKECDFETVTAYPPVVTTSIKERRRRMSLDKPSSMLKAVFDVDAVEEEEEGKVEHYDKEEDNKSLEDGIEEEKKEERVEQYEKGGAGGVSGYTAAETTDSNNECQKVADAMTRQSKRMLSSKRVSMLRRSTMRLTRELQKPGMIIEEKGFPGELTPEEVQIVADFRRELTQRDPIYTEIVGQYKSIEDEPYALCRFLRARKFVIEDVFTLLDQGKEHWIEAKKYNFYPNLQQDALNGIPPSLFHRQYPMLHVGSARNGCPVSYFNAGKINSEGVLSLIPLEQIVPYFWHGFFYDFTSRMKTLQQKNGNIVRCETVNVYDLQGMSRSQMNSDATDVIKMANTITCCFPETLHCLIIINAPSFFSFAWSLIKRFIDPRTASKIEVYSGTKKGNRRLSELIHEDELLSDYGGNGPSSQDIIERYQKEENAALHRRFVELLHIPKNGESSYTFNLSEARECANVHVYSRSLLGVKMSLYQDKKCIVKDLDINGHDSSNNDDGVDEENNHTRPYCKQLASNAVGPGIFCIKGKNNSKTVPTFFLVVADVSIT